MNDVSRPTNPVGMSAEEAAVRADLAACYRLVADYGWDDLAGTHMSAVVPGEEAMLVNPFGMLFEEMTASSLVKISLKDGKVLQDTPYPVNPTSYTIHSAVHQVRRDVGCAIHLHTVHNMAVSALAEGLLPLTQSALLITEDLAYHEFEGVAVNLEERERLQRDLGDRNHMILRNHGALVVGATVAEAFKRAYAFEKICAAQCLTLAMGRPLNPIAPAAAAQLAGRPASNKQARLELMWQGLRNRLDRRDPRYREQG